MKRTLTVALMVLVLTTSFALLAGAKGYTEVVMVQNLTDLVEKAHDLDGSTVVFTGEVFGDRMQRRDGTWLSVGSPSTVVMGVWTTGDMASQVTHLGRYGTNGDVVTVTGQFHRACAQHGGDMDVHATRIEIVQVG